MDKKTFGLTATICVAALAASFVLTITDHRLCAQETANNSERSKEPLAQRLIGTWKLESATVPQGLPSEATVPRRMPSGIGTRLTMFTGTHWCVIQPDAETGVIVYNIGGRYELDGNILKMTREFAGEPTKYAIGTAGDFQITVDGDAMEQTDPRRLLVQTWKRIN
jgi:hypothetical protein